MADIFPDDRYDPQAAKDKLKALEKEAQIIRDDTALLAKKEKLLTKSGPNDGGRAAEEAIANRERASEASARRVLLDNQAAGKIAQDRLRFAQAEEQYFQRLFGRPRPGQAQLPRASGVAPLIQRGPGPTTLPPGTINRLYGPSAEPLRGVGPGIQLGGIGSTTPNLAQQIERANALASQEAQDYRRLQEALRRSPIGPAQSRSGPLLLGSGQGPTLSTQSSQLLKDLRQQGGGRLGGGPGLAQISETLKLEGERNKVLSEAEPLIQSNAAAQARLSQEFAIQTRNVAINSNAYRRHGALTTEFISAAAKGQVTFREFGFQIGATIAKFGGWTAAAASVYGALGALQALGRGAIASEDGVNKLNRVVTHELPGGADAARQKFRDLSRQFNLPIGQVTETVYGLAKAYSGDLPSAFKAAESSLFAVKVGELSAADATKYLTSIFQGFRLEAAQVPDLFDAINQAQNKFGGDTKNTIAGVAKAAGAFKAAGGSYVELISLITAGSRLTGASGENVGTAIARSASVILTPQGQKRLTAAGLNPKQTYPDLLKQAFQQAQGASPTRTEEIARALVPSGGQFARIFVPLLQNKDLFDKIVATEAGRAGSATRELARALRSPTEVLKRIGTDLEQLGSSLAQNGLLTPIALLAKTVDGMLASVVKLSDALGSLGTLGKLGVPALEIGGLVGLARRFDVGGSTGIPLLGRNPQAKLGAQIRKGVDDQLTFATDLARTESQNAALASFRAQTLKSENLAAQAAVRDAATTDEVAAAKKRLAAILVREEEAINAEILASARATEARDLVALTERQRLKLADGSAATVTRARAESAGVFVASPLERGNGLGAGPIASFQRGRQEAQTAAARLALQAEGLGAARLGQGIAVAGTGLALAAGGLRAAGTAVRGFGSRLLGFFSGPVGILALIGIPFLIQAIDKAKQRAEEEQLALRAAVTSRSGGKVIRQTIRTTQDDPLKRSISLNPITDIGLGVSALGELFSDPGGGRRQARIDAAKRAQRDREALLRDQVDGRLFTQNQIFDQFDTNRLTIGKRRALEIELRQQQSSLAQSGRTGTDGTVLQGAGATAKAASDRRIQEILAGLHQLDLARSAVNHALGQLTDAKSLQAYTAETQGRIQLQGLTPANLRRVTGTVSRTRELLARGAITFADAANSVQANLNAATQQIQSDLDTALSHVGATNFAARSHLIADAVARTRAVQKSLHAAVAATGRNIANAEQALAALNLAIGQELRNLLQSPSIRGLVSLIKLGSAGDSVAKQLKDLRAQSKGLSQSLGPNDPTNTELGSLKKQSADNSKQAADAAKQAADKAKQDAQAAYQKRLDLLQANQNLATAQAGEDPVAAARIAVQFDRKRLAIAKTQIEKLNDRAQLLTDETGLRGAIVNEDIATADFQHNIGKLTDDQYIQQLKKILKTKKLSTAIRRQLLEQIYQLQHQDSSNFELDVGNIRLPTVYDIRRAVAVGREGSSITHQTVSTTINVARPEDATLVGAHLDKYLGGTSRSIRRATGAL